MPAKTMIIICEKYVFENNEKLLKVYQQSNENLSKSMSVKVIKIC